MASLTPDQIEELRRIITDAATASAVVTAGYNVSDDELLRLIKAGYIDPAKIENLALDSFTFGQLMNRFPEAKGMAYRQFQKRMASDPIPLSSAEHRAYESAEMRAGLYMVGLGDRFQQELTQAIVQSETAENVTARATTGELATRLARLTEDFERDWGRVAATESHNAHQEGFLASTIERHGDDELMAKIPEPDACEHCLRLYLGADGLPVVHPASWWQAQGTNAGLKARDWKAVLGAMHPWCFPAGSLVLTSRGEVPIESVRIGDSVVTAEGRWSLVSQTFRHYYHGPMVSIEAGGRRLLSTPDHEFRVCSGWAAAKHLREGGHVRKIAFSKTGNAPSLARQERRLARILLGFTASGMPITAVDFDGQLARPIYQIDQERPDDSSGLESQSVVGEGIHKPTLKLGKNLSFSVAKSLNDFLVRVDSPPRGFVSRTGQFFALVGGKSLHADLVSFGAAALGSPCGLDALDDGATAHSELAGYRLYGEIVVEVQLEDDVQGDRDSLLRHASECTSRNVNVNSVGVEAWSGWIYNLSVRGDESYVVEGLAVHNCRCQLVRVPAGFAFDESMDLVPESEIEKSDKIPGGLAAGKPDSDFDAKKLAAGVKVEMEHTTSAAVAREIAKDHLAEDPDYYEKLQTIEKAESLEKARKLHDRRKFQGFDVSIENRVGSIRHWYDVGEQREGQTKMICDYGYIEGTKGISWD